MRKYLLIAVFLLSGLAQHAEAADFYVCPDSQGEYGNENGLSLANCFDGWGVASTTGTWYAQATSTSAGDTIHVCGDWTSADTRAIINDQGSAGTYITLDGSPGPCGRSSTSTVSRSGLTGTNGRAISAVGKSYIKFKNLVIKDCDQYCISWDYNSSVNDETYLALENVTFQNCGQGTAPGDCVWKRGGGLTVAHSSFDDCYEDCIWMNGNNADIRDSFFTNISTGSILGDAMQIGHADLMDTGYTRIYNNYCDHQDSDVKYCVLIGPTLGAFSTVDVKNNIMLCPKDRTNATTSNQCHPIYVDAASTTVVTISGNFTQGGEIGISLSSTTTCTFREPARITGNIVYNAKDSGIFTDGNIDNAIIANNTVSTSSQDGIHIGKGNSTFTVVNNLLFNNNTALFLTGAISFRGYNGYYNNGTTTSTSGVSGSASSTELVGNPQFVNTDNPTTVIQNYRLAPTSPLKGAGVRIGDYTDYLGRYFNYKPSIGAYEVGSGDFSSTRNWAI